MIHIHNFPDQFPLYVYANIIHFSHTHVQRFKDTEKSNYAGGDTSWEEEKLGSYANRYELTSQHCSHESSICV